MPIEDDNKLRDSIDNEARIALTKLTRDSFICAVRDGYVKYRSGVNKPINTDNEIVNNVANVALGITKRFLFIEHVSLGLRLLKGNVRISDILKNTTDDNFLTQLTELLKSPISGKNRDSLNYLIVEQIMKRKAKNDHEAKLMIDAIIKNIENTIELKVIKSPKKKTS